MVWPFLMAFSVLLIAAAYVVGNGKALRCALVVFAGLVIIRAALLFSAVQRYDILIISAIWVVMAALISRQVAAEDMRFLFVRIFLVLNGATGVWAKVVDAPRVVGSPPYVAGDLLLIGAMLLIGWSLRHDVVDKLSGSSNRTPGLVGNYSLRNRGFGFGRIHLARGAEGQEMHQQKVTADG